MPPLRFQFTISGMLWATFWAAMSAAAWAVKVSSVETPTWWMLLVVAARLVGPFAAVIAVFGVRVALYALIACLLLAPILYFVAIGFGLMAPMPRQH